MKAIIVKYRPSTNTKPACYVARAEGVKPYRGTSTESAATGLCIRQGWSGTLVSGGLPDGSEVFCFMGSDKVEIPVRERYRAGDGTVFDTLERAEAYRVGLAKRTGITVAVERVQG